MAKLYRNLCLCLAIIIFFLWSIFPPEERLRLGKDLRGGVTLVYQLEIGPTEDAAKVVSDTIEVLRNRVDPDGLLEISMVRQGRDRIEITMPLPRQEVKDLKAVYENALRQLGRTSVTRDRLADLLTLSGPERDAKVAELSDGNDRRRQLLGELIVAAEEARAARAELEKARVENAPAATVDALIDRAGGAESKQEDLLRRVLATVLPANDVRQALNLSDRRGSIEGDDGQRIEVPSPRERAIARIRERFPEANQQLDAILVKFKAYADRRTTLDDPQDLVRLLQGAGVLSFRITVKPQQLADEDRLRRELQEKGPRLATSPEARWFKINKIENWYRSAAELKALQANAAEYFRGRGYVAEEYQGQYYMLAWDTRSTRLTQAEGDWGVERASESRDQFNLPSIAFQMDARGAFLLGELTKDHIKDQMAVLLDDEIYTAPTLQSAISKNGEITGSFSAEERRYLIRTLGGGSLQAKLSPEPISISSIGPELGADNLQKGFLSGVVALIVVSGFIIVYYFGAGVIAVIALCANAILVLGAMSLNKAAFSMPGIAGVILTFGMAVDSNVLVYERIREEVLRGADHRTATRIGFDKALSSIVDGNVTNLIVCIVLAYTGTAEIRGFAITMGIGVISTLFAALIFSRFLFQFTQSVLGLRCVNMLPLAVPSIQRILTPRIDWLRLRPFFFAFSAMYVAIGLGAVVFQGREMLDNEFRGGTAVTLDLKPSAPGSPDRLTMTRAEVQDRLQQLAKESAADSPLRELINADVVPIDPRGDGVTSDRFTIKTILTDSQLVLESIVQKFSDKLETLPAIRFAGSDASQWSDAPVHRVVTPDLGANLGVALTTPRSVAESIGGVAIYLDEITPPQPLQTLQQRLESVRASTDFADTLSRSKRIIILNGDESAVRTAALVVFDETARVFDNEVRWTEQMASREWELTRRALTEAQLPASVVLFSAAIADTFRAQAIVATTLSFVLISLYIWIRFKSLRYSLAALVALVHDVLVVVACIAICEIIYNTPATEGVARTLGLLPFRIDLNMIAALLTIAGYSLNDTIVIMDRIRETKGKSAEADYDMINTAVNQTLSRTVITGGSTLFSCLALYVLGGEGMRAFAFALTVGLIVGTYSSVAVAAPLVWNGKRSKAEEPVADGALVGR